MRRSVSLQEEKETRNISLSSAHAQGKGYVRTQKGQPLKARRRCLTTNQPCRLLDLGLRASRTMTK